MYIAIFAVIAVILLVIALSGNVADGPEYRFDMDTNLIEVTRSTG